MEFRTHYDSPLGGITLACDGAALTGLWFDGQKYFPEAPAGDDQKKPPAVLDEAVRWLDLYFSGQAPGFTLALRMDTTPFRKTVWELLLAIPYGQTATYGEIARRTAERLGREHMSAQAVGGAVGHNPISLIIPCHRVIGTDGSLTGYAGGLDRKLELLKLERISVDALRVPAHGAARP